MAKNNHVKETLAKLEQGVKDLFESDNFTDYLKVMSRFHKYSFRNIMLIYMQRPDASMVAGFRAWQTKFNRQVKKGEKAIKILAPAPFLIKEEKEKLDPVTKLPILDENGLPVFEYTEMLLARFKLVNVFDIAQTDGKPLPTLVQDLTGNVEQYEAFMDALKAVSPLPIVFEQMPENQDGACRFGKEIAIREGMSEVQTVNAIIHEIAHAKLHDTNNADIENSESKDRRTEEVEAESVAFTTLSFFNIETGANSFGYLGEWSEGRELKELYASLDTISKASGELIESIDNEFQAIIKDRSINMTISEIGSIEETEPINMDKPEHGLYQKFANLFPKFASGEYNYMMLSAGESFMPLSLEYIFGDRISVMHTYKLNGDTCYEPMMAFRFNNIGKTMTACMYEQSIPPIYQYFDDDGIGRSVNGNGDNHEMPGLESQLNDFASQWLDNISEQGYVPVRAKKEIDGVDVRILFDNNGEPIEPEKEYEIGFRFTGSGIEALNHADKQDGEYKAVARINTDRSITYLDDKLPHEVKASIEAASINIDDTIFETPPSPIKSKAAMLDLSLPDPSITISDMEEYGYSGNDMFPLSQGRALELFDTGHAIYLLHTDNTESMAFERGDISDHDGLSGIERDEWENSPVRAAQLAIATNTEKDRESELLHESGNRFGIYQLKDIEELRSHRFTPMTELQENNLDVQRANYELVYTAPFDERVEFLTDRHEILNGIFQKFNTEHPDDYMGHSLSVSDVVVLKYNKSDISSHGVAPGFRTNRTSNSLLFRMIA